LGIPVYSFPIAKAKNDDSGTILNDNGLNALFLLNIFGNILKFCNFKY